MKMSNIERNISYSLAKGIVTTFDTTLEIIYRLSRISLFKDVQLSKDANIPTSFKMALELFSEINENSSEKDYMKCIDFVSNISNKDWIFLESLRKETPMTDFYNYCRKLRDLVEHKLSTPLKLWKQAKNDANHFSSVYEQLSQELNEVRQSVEKARLLRDKAMPEEASKEEELKNMVSASEDFKSLHPFFVISNSEENMKLLTTFKEKRMELLKEKGAAMEEDLKKAAAKFRNEIQTITEETVKTKCLIEWLEEKHNDKLKEYNELLKKEWEKFSGEMEESRDLSKVYQEINSIYMNIVAMKTLEKEVKAATTLQAYCRGYLTRKRLKEFSFM